MKTKQKVALIAAAMGMSLLGSAFANTVKYQLNQPMQVTYQVAHQKAGGPIVLGQRTRLNGNTVHLQQNGYSFVGVVTDNINGHELPESAKQFRGAQSCTASTGKNNPNASIKLTFTPKTTTQKGRIQCAHSV